VIQIGIRVMANDTGICDAASRGSGQINEFLPLIADLFLEEIDLLTAASSVLATHVSRIEADAERCRHFVDRSPMIVTALLPLVGYERATALIREYDRLRAENPSGDQANVRSFLENKLGKELTGQVLSPHHLTMLGYRKNGYDTQGE
jgi:aspartate ammonia-lyase